ncbi:MAG: tRNA (adenosine(37)-N6)-threonylcarbamoyltransferase complex transferase subunit TsaD [Bowdeniella nasicola]|nr:tRNA (adenosine(37)-N6)-threonylcarbamoyltransferase complex transferase subunit TsaD [Bowdeniella nasicola]
MKDAAPLVLGIESTCDETGVALVRGNELLADVTATSMDEYARYGGIIPEIASRAHLESFLPTMYAALEKAGVGLQEVAAIACAAGPGLIGSLTVGTAAAKALALATGKPLYGVNHILGHVAVDQLVHGPLPQPTIALVVSGGHSNLLLIRDLATDVVELGGTLDDAAGEAFDKVGRLLGLPYPGGPHLDRLAQAGDERAIAFPRALRSGEDRKKYPYDFSFSGLKTAVARYLAHHWPDGQIPEQAKADIAASFSAAVNDSLIDRAIRACRDHECTTLVIGGGFSANSHLRRLAAERAEGIEVRIPPIRYCTDNGAMIGALGSVVVRASLTPSGLGFANDSSMPLTQAVIAA